MSKGFTSSRTESGFGTAYLDKVALFSFIREANLKAGSLGPFGLGHFCNIYYLGDVRQDYQGRVSSAIDYGREETNRLV